MTDQPDLRVSPTPPSTGGTKALIGLLLAGTAGMIIFLFVHLSKDGGIRPGVQTAHAECTKGQRDCLPDVNYTDTDGVKYTHASLAGKVVLVNFWATWCHPCQSEIPDLSKTYEKYKAKGVVFLGVMTDSPDNQQLLNFKSDYEMSYPVVRSNSDLMVSYNYPDALPTTFVYDRGGKQIYSHVGPLRERELDSLIGQLVAQN
jgi:thiol-disulfide isomerase/thioredoxin